MNLIRRLSRTAQRVRDAGTKLTVEFTHFDDGFLSINGSGKGDYTGRSRTMVGVYPFCHADDRGIQKLHQQIKIYRCRISARRR